MLRFAPKSSYSLHLWNGNRSSIHHTKEWQNERQVIFHCQDEMDDHIDSHCPLNMCQDFETPRVGVGSAKPYFGKGTERQRQCIPHRVDSPCASDAVTVYGLGIRVRRDSWVSVMYAEGLHSGESSVTFQRTDRHGILGQKPTDFHVSV
jgi:hypothetical protein